MPSAALRRRKTIRWLAVYTLVFLAAAGLVFATFLHEGRSFIYYYAGEERDGFTQHYTAFVYIGRYIRDVFTGIFHGDFALKQFDFTLGFGEDVIQCLGYYGFGDPLMLLSAFVPRRLAGWFYQVYILLELWLAGLAFAFFGREKGYEGGWILPAALVYVFSGFALWAGLCHPEFLAPMIYFPLMLTGLERALDGKRPVFLAVVTAVFALTGYYWLFMGTLFVCMYALVRFARHSAGHRPAERLGELGRFFLRAAGGYALGLMTASAIFLPNVMGFLQSNRVGAGKGVPELVLDAGERLNVLLGLISPGSWNFAALAAVTLPALVLLLLRREKQYRDMQAMAVLLAAFSLMPVCGWLFNVGAYETTRWYVFLNFFAAFFVLMGLDELTRLTRRGCVACAASVVLYGWAVWAQGGQPGSLIALGILAGTAAVLLLLGLVRGKTNAGRAVCAVLTALVALNCAWSGFMTYAPGQGGYAQMFAPAGLVERETAAMPAAAVPDCLPWQRVAQVYDKNPNASMLLDYAGTASYFSTSNGNTACFLTDMELPVHNKVLFPDLDRRTVLHALLTTRWFAAGESGISAPWGYTGGEGGLWQDEGVLPVGFTYDTIVSDKYWNGLSALEKQELMLQAVYVQGLEETGDVPRSQLTRVETTGTALQNADWQDGQLNAYRSGGGLTVNFAGLPGCETYLRLKNVSLAWSDTAQLALQVQAGDSRERYVFSGKNFLWHSEQESVLLNLGCSPEGLTRAELVFEQPGGLRLEDIEVWCQPMDEYEAWREELRTESLTDVQVTTNRIRGTITAAGDRILCFAIPYSPGWDVYVDGERAESLKANDFLLAVKLDAGAHDVELRYHSPGFRAGLLLCVMGAAGIAALVVCKRKDERKGESGHG